MSREPLEPPAGGDLNRAVKLSKTVDIDLPIDGPEVPPGAPEALARGCTCYPGKNKNGKGVAVPGRRGPLYKANSTCPIHGLEAIEGLLRKSNPA